MTEIISEAAPRIKFMTERQGYFAAEATPDLLRLAALQTSLEALGVIPILNDGLLGGNCAMRDPAAPGTLITKSGKAPGAVLTPQDFVLLTSFNRTSWSATYLSPTPDMRPSSDAPLHAAALAVDCVERYGWAEAPAVAVHGHALVEGDGLEAAQRAGLPISEAETLFSTPEDLAALEALFSSHPYPSNSCYIRRGHGFFLLAKDAASAEAKFREAVLPLLGLADGGTPL